MACADENDLEILYELRWKNRVRNNKNDDDRANIMGIIDTPDTCADWTTFKSYLVNLTQNFGTSEDIAISYIDSDGEEIQITPDNYESALEYFREKGRKGQKVILELKKNPYHNIFLKKMNRSKSSHGSKEKSRSDKHGSKKRSYEAVIPTLESDQTDEEDEPPKWFTNYMDKFSQNLESFIIDVMESHLQSPKRTSRADKKFRKRNLDDDSSDCVDTLAALALEMRKPSLSATHKPKLYDHLTGLKDYKAEKKLIKLEMKTKRMLEKQSLLTARLDVKQMEKVKKSSLSAKTHKRHSSFAQLPPEIVHGDKPKSAEPPKKNVIFDLAADNVDVSMIEKMDAVPLYRQTQAEFANRNEIIRKTWEVKNTGKFPWTDDTVLRFTWGSSSLVPIQNVVPVPKLKPGEVGEINVTLKAPDAVGRFESYWHFFHKNIRFGQWLGCVFVIGIPNRYPSVCCPLVHTSNDRAVDLSVKCQRHWPDNASINEPKIENGQDKRSTASTQTSPKPCDTLEKTPETTPGKPSPEPPRKCSKFSAPEVSVVHNINEDQSITYNLTLEKPCCFTLNNLETTIENESAATTKAPEAGGATNDTEVLAENFNNLSMIVHKNNSVSECNDDDSDNISVISRTSSVDSSGLGDEFVMLGSSDNGEKNTDGDIKVDDSDEDNSDNNNNMEPLNSFTDHESIKSNIEVVPMFVLSESGVQKNDEDGDFENVVKINEEAVIVEDLPAMVTGEPVLKPDKPECCHQDPNQSSPLTRHGFAHSTFGDPNFGNGPNGPRFPPGWYPSSSSMSHPTWRNGCSAFGNDFAVSDFSRVNEYLTPDGYQRSFPYPEHLYHCRNHSANWNAHDIYAPPTANQRRFIFTRYGGGYEYVPHGRQEGDPNLSRSQGANIDRFGCYMEAKPHRYGIYQGEQNVPERDNLSESFETIIKKPDRPSTSPPVLNSEKNETTTRYSYVFDNKVPVATNEPSTTEAATPKDNTQVRNDAPNETLGENFVNGAVNAASSALITACTVFEKLRNVKDEVGEFASTTVPVLINAARTPLAHSSPVPPSSNASTAGSDIPSVVVSDSDAPPRREFEQILPRFKQNNGFIRFRLSDHTKHHFMMKQ